MLLFCLTIAFNLLWYHSIHALPLSLAKTLTNREVSHPGVNAMDPHFQKLRKRGMECSKGIPKFPFEILSGILRLSLLSSY
jgi:hypothetical protein